MHDDASRPDEISGRFASSLLISLLIHLIGLSVVVPEPLHDRMASPSLIATFHQAKLANKIPPTQSARLPVSASDRLPTPETGSSLSDDTRQKGESMSLPIREPEYFQPDALTVSAYPLEEPKLRSPDLLAYPVTGEARLRLFISADGTVDKIDVVWTSLAPQHVERMQAAFKKVPFQPARIGDTPVSSILLIVVGARSLMPGRALDAQETPDFGNREGVD